MDIFASTPKTGLKTDYFFRGASLDNIHYFTNGLNRMIAYDLVTATNMGIIVPFSAATDGSDIAGSLTAGTVRKVMYEYYNINKGYSSGFSPESAEITIGTSGGRRVNIPANSDVDSQVTHVRVYVTRDAGSVHYYEGLKAYTGSAITFDITQADASRPTVMGELSSDGQSNVDVHSVPPTSKYLMAHQNRLWFYGTEIYEVAMTFTNGDKTVTGSGFVDGMRNMLVQAKGDGRIYVIDGVPTSDTEFEMTKEYDGTTGSYLGYILGEDSVLYYSYKTTRGRPRPESVPASDEVSHWIPVAKDESSTGPGTGMGKVGGVTPIIGKRNSLYILVGDKPGNYEVELLSDQEGLVSDRSGANNEIGDFMFASINGVNITNGEAVSSITDLNIQNIFTGEDDPPWYVNKDRMQYCHGVYDKTNRRYLLWVASSDSSVENKCLVYDFKKIDGNPIGWSWWNIKAVCSAIIVDDYGVAWVCWQDALGYVYKLDASVTNDGAGMSEAETRRGTATGGATTYLDDSAATFNTVGDGLTGIKIKILSGTSSGDERIISSNTAPRITPTVAFTTAIDDTSVYAIGYIDSYRTTGWLDFGGLLDKILDKIKMVFKTTTATFSAYWEHYTNFSTTQTGSTQYIDMSNSDGYHSARLAANRSKHHQLKFGSCDTDRVITIKEIEIEGGVFGAPKEDAGVTS